MFSKNRSLAFFASTALIVTGCNLKLNESPPPKPHPEAKLGFETKCLSGALPVLSDFFEGTAEPEAIAKTWDCFGGAIELFQRKVKGHEKAQYTPQELESFFEDYFFSEGTHLTPALLDELMRLKQILIGGSNTAVTQGELSQLIDFAQEAKGLSLELLPYMKVYVQSWELGGADRKPADLEFFASADQVLRHAAQVVGDRLARNQQSYEADHFVTFLEELRGLADRPWPFVDQIRKAFPLVKKMKKSLVGGDESVVTAPEWPRFGLLGARGYIQYLRYHYFLQKAASPRRWAVDDLLRSVDGLFSFMGDMVRGKPQGRLLKTEIYEILDSFNALFPDLVITHGLVDETLKLKQVLGGGGTEEVLPEEFDRLRAKVEELHPLADKASPFLDFYLLGWKPADVHAPEAHRFALDAHAALQELGEKLGSLLETGYDLNNLTRLAREWDRTFPPQDGEESWGARADRFLPLLIAVKGIVSNDSGSVIAKEKWSFLLSSAAGALSRYLDFRYFVRDEPTVLRGPGLQGLSDLVDASRLVIDAILLKRANKTVAFAELDGLLEALRASDLLPDYLSVQTMKPLTRVLMRRILLSPEKRFAGRIPQGLTPEATAVLQTQFAAWVDGQMIALDLFPTDSTEMDGPRLLRELKKLPEGRARDDFRASVNSPLPLALDAEKRLFIAPNASIAYRGIAMDRLNLARMMVRLVNNAYIEEPARLWNGRGFNLAEANTLFRDVKPIAVKLGLIEADNTTFANSRFREANLFTPHADGNDLVNLVEGMDLASFIMSGLELNTRMKQALEESCSVSIRRETPRVPLRCYLQVYRRLAPEVFTSLPRFARVASRLSQVDFERMMTDFLIATGWQNDQSGRVNMNDLTLVPHVIQYTEAIMAKFDTDRNDHIDRAEALRAFPLFRDTMKSVAPEGMDTDQILEGAFAYVLVYGKVPQTLVEQLKFLGLWVPNRDTWPVWADRQKLARVLAYIAELTNKTP